jgi:hypothetical protein
MSPPSKFMAVEILVDEILDKDLGVFAAVAESRE